MDETRDIYARIGAMNANITKRQQEIATRDQDLPAREPMSKEQVLTALQDMITRVNAQLHPEVEVPTVPVREIPKALQDKIDAMKKKVNEKISASKADGQWQEKPTWDSLYNKYVLSRNSDSEASEEEIVLPEGVVELIKPFSDNLGVTPVELFAMVEDVPNLSEAVIRKICTIQHLNYDSIFPPNLDPEQRASLDIYFKMAFLSLKKKSEDKKAGHS